MPAPIAACADSTTARDQQARLVLHLLIGRTWQLPGIRQQVGYKPAQHTTVGMPVSPMQAGHIQRLCKLETPSSDLILASAADKEPYGPDNHFARLPPIHIACALPAHAGTGALDQGLPSATPTMGINKAICTAQASTTDKMNHASNSTKEY